MKEYIVKATRLFNDGLENKERKAGDIFNCTEERYQVLKQHNAVELVEVSTPEGTAEQEPKKKTTRAKKK